MTELAYDERATNFFTTNTTVFSTAASALVGGLSVTVVGTGAPVLVEFYAPRIGHSSAAAVASYFVVNGAVTPSTSQYRNWSQDSGGSMTRRMVLTAGTSYTIEVGLVGGAAGTVTAYGQVALGSAAGTMHLRVSD